MIRTSTIAVISALGLSLALVGCSDSDADESPDAAATASNYALSSVVFGDEASSTSTTSTCSRA